MKRTAPGPAPNFLRRLLFGGDHLAAQVHAEVVVRVHLEEELAAAAGDAVARAEAAGRRHDPFDDQLVALRVAARVEHGEVACEGGEETIVRHG